MKPGKLLTGKLRVFCMDGEQECVDPAHGAVPHSCLHWFCPFSLLLPVHSSLSSHISSSPRQTKQRLQKSGHRPQKPSWTQCSKWKKNGKMKMIPAMSPWEAGQKGGAGRRDAQHCRGTGGTEPLPEEVDSRVDKSAGRGLGLGCAATWSYKLT